MVKVWLMIMLMSSPNMPSVKYNAILYKTEDECNEALVSYLNYYESRPPSYKEKVVTDAFCLPFEAFPIKGLQKDTSA
tara:strand:+ start:46 stop:279 length:234 start_codon:yes stop_codon:yes gene_type:complete